MVPLEFGDRIRLEKTGGGICVKTTGINLNIPERANLAYRAAGLFFTATGITGGCRIFIKKKIPPGGGLGGGSSNAATVLLGLNYLFDHPLNPAQLNRLARELGSDVPFSFNLNPASPGDEVRNSDRSLSRLSESSSITRGLKYQRAGHMKDWTG